MKEINLLIGGCKEIGIEITDSQIYQFEKYYSMVIDWNSKINLTAITDEKEFIIKHILDSLLVVRAINFKDINSIIDIGTGAGFPGIPLKIIFNNINFTLLDSLKKRINFLKLVCDELDLKKIKCIHGRAEDYGSNPQYRETYDLCVSRAVSNLAVLSEYCIPFIKINGNFISYKSSNSNKEIDESKRAIQILGGKISNISSYELPNSNIDRTFVNIIKTSSTNVKYPRKAGKPLKNSL